MAKFNSKKVVEKITSYEGAELYKRKPIEAWFNMLFSSFLDNQYYETSNKQIKRFIELTEKVADTYGYTFVGKAAIFARNELGMRSISQLTAAWLNDKSFQEKRKFYKAFMRRPDDVSEIFAAVDFLKGKRSHALVKGCADYLSSLGEYQITKYKMNGHKYNMYDLINLTHAKSNVINAFKNDLLESPDTWEVNISKQQSKEQRQATWKEMVEENKLGYMALIRNLNNILDNPDIDHMWINKYLVHQIVNEDKIRKSLIFPYRLYTAYKNLNTDNYNVINALGNAFMLATKNVPKFNGLNAVILDVSGSMESYVSQKSKVTLKEIGACFAATLILNGSDVDFIKFGTSAKRKIFSKIANPFDMIASICNNENLGYGTEIYSAMNIMRERYDRIFLISDMQIFEHNYYYQDNTKIWNDRYRNIMTYSFDLANYSSQIVPPSDNFMFLTSINDALFKYVDFIDNKEKNIINIINNINF